MRPACPPQAAANRPQGRRDARPYVGGHGAGTQARGARRSARAPRGGRARTRRILCRTGRPAPASPSEGPHNPAGQMRRDLGRPLMFVPYSRAKGCRYLMALALTCVLYPFRIEFCGTWIRRRRDIQFACDTAFGGVEAFASALRNSSELKAEIILLRIFVVHDLVAFEYPFRNQAQFVALASNWRFHRIL